MRTVRLAREAGGLEQLLPPGIDDWKDCPYVLFEAIQMGLQFASWEENLEQEEIPPRAIWFNDKALREHFQAVERRRKERFKADGPGEIEDPVQNDAARGLIVGN